MLENYVVFAEKVRRTTTCDIFLPYQRQYPAKFCICLLGDEELNDPIFYGNLYTWGHSIHTRKCWASLRNGTKDFTQSSTCSNVTVAKY